MTFATRTETEIAFPHEPRTLFFVTSSLIVLAASRLTSKLDAFLAGRKDFFFKQVCGGGGGMADKIIMTRVHCRRLSDYRVNSLEIVYYIIICVELRRNAMIRVSDISSDVTSSI